MTGAAYTQKRTRVAAKNMSARTAGGASTLAYHQRRLGVFFMEWYWHFILGEPEFLQPRYTRYTQLPRRGGRQG